MPLYASDEERGFIRDIIANPTDDTPRLIYADWLDERGDPTLRDNEHAEFIRVQCRLAQLPSETPLPIVRLAQLRVSPKKVSWLDALPDVLQPTSTYGHWLRGYTSYSEASSAGLLGESGGKRFYAQDDNGLRYHCALDTYTILLNTHLQLPDHNLVEIIAVLLSHSSEEMHEPVLERSDLLKRERELWWGFYPHESTPTIPPWMQMDGYKVEICGGSKDGHETYYTRWLVPNAQPIGLLFTWRRGFPECVDSHYSCWYNLQLGPKVVLEYPLQNIRTLLDKVPLTHVRSHLPVGRFAWVQHQRPTTDYQTDPDIFRQLSVESLASDNTCIYPSEQSACNDLRRACLRWARQQAGLPPLLK